MEKNLPKEQQVKQQSIQDFQHSLPIFEYKNQILEAIKNNLSVVITGDTGSGKSTQLPQYVLDNTELTVDMLKNTDKKQELKIVITQPRRVAAISMAKRICYERSVKLGQEVGYTIRFDDQTTDKTVLRYVTDGILVRECLQDKDLNKYQFVILDEAHERSLYTDVLFALVKQAVERRKGGLKLIVTSATLNTDQFSNFFNKCPVIKMRGRSFPVEIKYGPCLATRRIEECVKAAIKLHLHEAPGDILAFLTGSEECEMARRIIINKLQCLKDKGKVVSSLLIFTLYGAQQSDEQNQVFIKAPADTRKLIFSTNIAETSLTIDNIGYVIDCGYVKQKCYNPRTGMDALIVVPISKVQAIQRSGRAGRTQEGKCYRMYSEQFYEEMKDYTIPEILRVNLSNVILQLKNMQINDVINFEYMESPDSDAILQALKQLFLLDAIDNNGKITALGNEMCRFPLEPSYSKALISAILMSCEEDMITLVSLLSTENVWSRPPRIKDEEFKQYEKKLKECVDLDGDHRTLINIYKRWVKSNYSDYICKENFWNIRALRTSENIKVQLRDLTKQTDLHICKQFYEDNSIYKIFLKSEKMVRNYSNRNPKHLSKEERKLFEQQLAEKTANQQLTPSDLVRMALSTGFFFNSARKMNNTEQQYLLIYPEGNIVDVDQQSVYAVSGNYPSYVIFTELGGTSAIKGVMRQLSQIDPEWIKKIIQKTQQVDVFKLAGMEFKNKRSLTVLKSEEVNKEDLKKKQEEESKIRDEKKTQAIARYQERKKLKIN